MAHIDGSSKRLSRSNDLGPVLAAHRKKAKITQAQLAEKLGVSRKTLIRLEGGMAENVSLATALRAMALVGLIVEVRPHRPPDIHQVMAQRATENNSRYAMTGAGVSTPIIVQTPPPKK